MTLKRRGETGRGCCRNCIKGHRALHRPMLNKVSINSSFIGDRNQCITDGGGQLRLSRAWEGQRWADRREEEKLNTTAGKEVYGYNESMKETTWRDRETALKKIITSSSSPLAWFPFLSVKISNTMFPHQQLPQGAGRTTRWRRAEAAYLPGGRVGQGSTGPVCSRCLLMTWSCQWESCSSSLLTTHGILMRQGTLFMLHTLDKYGLVCGFLFFF